MQTIKNQEDFNELMKAKAVVGEIRIWKNVKYQKQADGSWRVVKGQKVSKERYAKDELKVFGRNYFKYAGKPKEAIDFLLKERNGQVIGAIEREGLGKIDIIWGDERKGLRHIRKRHFIEQNDFKSYEDIADRISDILKNGQIGKFYENGMKVNIYKGEWKVTLTKSVVYDEDDNFREKLWVLTSYNKDIKIEDKIKKSLTILDGPDSSNDMDSARLNPLISSNALSVPKDTTNLNIEQQFMDEIIEKAKKSSPIGTEKTWGGKVYVKTANGWRPKGKGKSSKKDEQQSEAKTAKVDYSQHASKASDEQLQAAINDKDASLEVKQAAQKEIENRKGKVSDDKSANELGITSALQRILDAQEKGELDLDLSVINKIKEKIAKNKEAKETKPIDEKTLDSKLDKLKQDISDSIDKKLNEMNGFKKITQTYVKVDGQTIVLNMKGEDKYKAKKGSFYMESKPNEPLNEFKKRVKEEFEKTLKKEESKSELAVEAKKPESTKVEEKKDKIDKPVVKMDFIKSQAGMILYGKILQKLDEGKAVEFTENGVDYRFSRDEDKGEYLLEDLSNNKSMSWPKHQGVFALKDNLKKLDTKEEKNDVKFEAEKEFKEFLKKRNSQNDTLDKEQKERFGKVLDSVTIDENIEKRFKNYIEDEDFEEILSKYPYLESTQRAEVNKVLIDSGYLPVANGVLYSEWNGVKYKHFTGHTLEDEGEMIDYYEKQGKKLKVTKTQYKALKRYMGTDYEAIRDYNYGKGGGTGIALMAQLIAEAIDKNPCKENLVLYRRLEARDMNSLNELLNAEVGSVIEDKSFSSFSLKQLSSFGNDFQITLLAKKGDKVANINNTIAEYEYLTQRFSKFKVLAKGLNSIVVEMA